MNSPVPVGHIGVSVVELLVTEILYGDQGTDRTLLSVDNFHQKLPIRLLVLVFILEQSLGGGRDDGSQTSTLFQ